MMPAKRPGQTDLAATIVNKTIQDVLETLESREIKSKGVNVNAVGKSTFLHFVRLSDHSFDRPAIEVKNA
jgi:hypothetical protein